MNISIRRIILLSILLISGVNSFSQYYVKFKGDSIAFEKDSVVLALDNIISNNLHWEISKDSVTWESLNKTNDTLVIRIHDKYFYRAVLEEGTCYPIKSDVAFAGFKSIIVSDNTVVIDSTGGVYILPSGIKLVVPPSAVNENVTVSLHLLDSLNAELQLPFDVDIGKVFCAAIHCEPIQFLKPVKISIPAPNFQYNDIPCVFHFNTATEFWEKYTDKIICSEKMQLVEFTTYNLTSTRIQLIKNVFGFDNTIKKAEQEGDCMEGFIQVESSAHDFQGQMGSNECYVSSDETMVVFLECHGSPVNKSKIQEIGKDCEPVVIDDINEIKCLKKDESATINVRVTIGGKPIKDQHIDFFQIPEGLSIDKIEDFTNAGGEAQFIVTCTKENFSGIIGYRVTYAYYLQVIQASAFGIVVNNENYPQTGQITKKHIIKECPRIKSITILAIRNLKVGETTPIECECRDQNGELIDCGHVDYTLRDVYTFPARDIISVDAGIVAAVKPGLAAVQARSGDVVSDYERGYFSIAYEGELKDLSITFDNNIYKKCGCQEDFDNPPHEWTWWVVSFIGSYQMTLHLYPDNIPSVKLEGEGIITYSITGSTHCTGASFNDPVNKFANSLYLLPPESGIPTANNVIEGKEFNIRFDWITGNSSEWWRLRTLRGKAKMINPHEIDFTIMDFEPDVCIKKDVEGTCILK